ncbi:zinc transporter ZIP1-like [Lineus longissimus]|uniref:zinc transporter ZIP1-like n=1 Tax=Lineus longissimus TaxID=88925 RepID=UPI00315D74D2
MSSYVTAKVAVLVLVGVIPFLFALLPWLISASINLRCCRRENGIELAEKILNYLNFVAGGVFLGLILLHMVPEVTEEMAESLEAQGIHTHFPFGPFLVAIGLITFVVLEQIVMYCKGNDHQGKQAYGNHGNHETFTSQDNLEAEETTGLSTTFKHQKRHHRSYEAIPVEESAYIDDAHLLHDHVETSNNGPGRNSLLRTYALLVALSLHAIFDGMVIGFQDTESLLWELFVAIIFHKILVAFSLGSRLLKAKQQLSVKHYFGLIVVFCLMSPIGGTIAALLADYSKSPALKLTETILTALAAGSFMFVTFFEILRFDYDSKVNLIGVFCLILGFGAYSLELYLEGDRGHVH